MRQLGSCPLRLPFLNVAGLLTPRRLKLVMSRYSARRLLLVTSLLAKPKTRKASYKYFNLTLTELLFYMLSSTFMAYDSGRYSGYRPSGPSSGTPPYGAHLRVPLCPDTDTDTGAVKVLEIKVPASITIP